MCDEVFSPIPTLPSGRCPPHPNNLNEFAVQGVADLEPSYHTNTKTDTNTNTNTITITYTNTNTDTNTNTNTNTNIYSQSICHAISCQATRSTLPASMKTTFGSWPGEPD